MRRFCNRKLFNLDPADERVESEVQAQGNHGNPHYVNIIDNALSEYQDDHDEPDSLQHPFSVCESGSQSISGSDGSRATWTGKLDFILSCLSFAVGLGNVWRFPYKCYQNGGGAFLLPFIIMLALTGIPMFFLESSFGQYASSGVVSIWKACPIFQGIGVAMFLVSVLVCIYYNMIIAWTLFYLFASLQSPLPWATCNNHWNTAACELQDKALALNCTMHNGIWSNHSCHHTHMYNVSDNASSIQVTYQNNQSVADKSHGPSHEYFHNYVLDISEGFENMGVVRWKLVLCLMLSWILVAVCMIKGIRTSGKAVYFTASFPYLVLLILMVRGLTLPGSLQGILYYLTPQWSKLLSAKVWGDAAVQIFFSLAPGWGGLITLSSYNKFHNNCLRDTYIVCIGDCVTSFFAGFVIFAIIGYMAQELKVGIEDVAQEGAGLAFVVYPQLVTKLPVSPLWSVLFFLMLITLGLGTQFAIVGTIHTTIMDLFPNVFGRGVRSSLLLMGLCFLFFILGLSFCSQGGMYMLQLVDSYAATYSVLIIALVECLVLAWVYGYDRLLCNINEMLGKKIGVYWKIMWKFITPVTLVGILIFTCVEFKPSQYGDYQFPWWAETLGVGMSLTSVLAIPAVAVYKITTYGGKIPVFKGTTIQLSVSHILTEYSKNKDSFVPNDIYLTENQEAMPTKVRLGATKLIRMPTPHSRNTLSGLKDTAYL